MAYKPLIKKKRPPNNPNARIGQMHRTVRRPSPLPAANSSTMANCWNDPPHHNPTHHRRAHPNPDPEVA